MTTKDAEFVPEEVFGAKMILMGPPGVGKTWSTATLLSAGFEKVIYLFTEPGAEESVVDSCNANNLDISRVHWHYIAPANPSWDAMLKVATKINQVSYEDLSTLKQGLNKRDHAQFLLVLGALANFTCDRTGEVLGPVDKFPNTWVFIIDSLSGINIMALDLVVGAKPAPHQGEWGTGMQQEERLFTKLCASCRCFFILIAHVDRIRDEVEGRTFIMVSALGSKLAPKLPRFFGDHVRAIKDKGEFFWATDMQQHDLKQRLLPNSGKLKPNFVQWLNAWLKRYRFSKEDWLAQKTEGDMSDEQRIGTSDTDHRADAKTSNNSGTADERTGETTDATR